jgi:hypothetical protein
MRLPPPGKHRTSISRFGLIQCFRSARTRILGLLYREGIVYYSITLVVLVGGILVRL